MRHPSRVEHSRPRDAGRVRLPSALAVSVALLTLSGCMSRGFNAPGTEAGQRSTTQDTAFRLPPSFCAEAEDSAGEGTRRLDEQGRLWQAQDVQRAITSLFDIPGFEGLPSSAYAVAYERMTAARDAARCDPRNAMYAPDPLDRALNDALADMMTRNLVNVTRECFARMRRPLSAFEKSYLPQTNLYQSDLGGLWCSLFSQAYEQNWDAIRFAMASTGLYLTVNLGYALAALPHVDALWDPEMFPDYASRVARLESGGASSKGFRPTYDSFNAFLGKSLRVVADALSESDLAQCGTFEAAALVGEYSGVFDDVFGLVRDRSFDLGIGIARAQKKGDHPLVRPDVASGGRIVHSIRVDVLNANVLHRDPRLEESLDKLVRLGAHLRKVFGTRLFKVFGAITFKDAERIGQRKDAVACDVTR